MDVSNQRQEGEIVKTSFEPWTYMKRLERCSVETENQDGQDNI